MIKLRITKEKFYAIIQVMDITIRSLTDSLAGSVRDMNYAGIRADLYILTELSRKMRSRYILLEAHSGSHKVNISINMVEAYTIMKYREISHDSFHLSVIESITPQIVQKLIE